VERFFCSILIFKMKCLVETSILTYTDILYQLINLNNIYEGNLLGFFIEIWKLSLRKPTMCGPWRAVCRRAGWWRPAGPKSNVNGWPQASVGKKAAPSSSRKIKASLGKRYLNVNENLRGIWMNCWVAAARGFWDGCLGFWTFVFDLANSSRRVAGRSGSNRTP
jgi:hypothetical protein